MARFRAQIKGQRGSASRLGSAASGLHSDTNGWNIGSSVELHARGDHDTVSMMLTGGSNGPRNLGVEVVAFEEEGARTQVVIRFPGGEVSGYVGDLGWKLSARYDDVSVALTGGEVRR